MSPEDLRKLAATEHSYVASRMVTYREDDTTPPEAIRRLGVFADAVLAFLPKLADMGKGADTARAGKVEKDLAHARETMYEIAAILSEAQARLDGSEPALKTCSADCRCRTANGDRGCGKCHPDHYGNGETFIPCAAHVVFTDRQGAFGESSGTVTAQWPASGLYHGLVLVNALGERRLFGEPLKGQYSVQTVAPDGMTAGEPFSTTSPGWTPAMWSLYEGTIAAKPSAPRWDMVQAPPAKTKAEKPPAADRTLSLFETPVPAVPSGKTVGDYAPDDAQFVNWTAALNVALAKTGKEPVPTEKVRSVFDAWKAEHATEEKSNPAATFWHAARAAIVGN